MLGMTRFLETEVNEIFVINKGNLNSFHLRPKFMTEYSEAENVPVTNVTSSKMVGQIVRIGTDNVNGLSLVMRSLPALTEVDEIEGYVDSAALQVEWPVTGTNPVILEETIVSDHDGSTSTQSMRLNLEKSGDTWTNTITSIDLTEGTIQFHINQTIGNNDAILEVFIGDGTNTKSTQIAVQDINRWQQVSFNEQSLTEDGGGTTDVSAITKVGFRVLENKQANYAYIDNVYLAESPTGSVNIKLYDMGETKPEAGVTTLDDGTQFTSIGDLGKNQTFLSEVPFTVNPGFQKFHIDRFNAGLAKEFDANVELTPDNYYAIVIEYVDIDVEVLGTRYTESNAPYYNSGFAFECPDTSTPISYPNDKDQDLTFALYASTMCYVAGYKLRFNAVPDITSSAHIFIQKDTFISTRDLSNDHRDNVQVYEHELKNLSTPQGIEMNGGGKFTVYYTDTARDDVTRIALQVTFHHDPTKFKRWG